MRCRSSSTSDKPNRRGRKSIGTEVAQHRGIERGVPFEPAVEIAAERVVSVELIDQLEQGAGTEIVDTRNQPLPLEAVQSLRLIGILV
jgi:hypothetical protein